MDEPLISHDPEDEVLRIRRAHITDEEPPALEYGEGARAAVEENSVQIYDFFRRNIAEYQPLTSFPDIESFVSREEPQTQPVDGMMSEDEAEANLGDMRRVDERLARRDDMPKEW
ncbi:hypothetical protein LTR56_012489 [Elasticomyces elasticus]|nr:hypothetical protein LTR22_023220 [Elasticomyces elasticus]KAK3639321.1 hypothetical protein LTR56_012489 [Elasticomyces elasticus]KAK4907339.1 hypothetical protein LTR49_023623 [Elasticomyces elasticus]KAK5748390.1 hypothetical protein LTS12_021562 [Elasticomyces elasticus]